MGDRRGEAFARDGYLFPSIRKGVISDATWSRLTERRGMDARPHGFRTSFRTRLAEATDAPEQVAETCLAHVVGSKVARSYQRSDYLEQRRALMERWANFIDRRRGQSRANGARMTPDLQSIPERIGWATAVKARAPAYALQLEVRLRDNSRDNAAGRHRLSASGSRVLHRRRSAGEGSADARWQSRRRALSISSFPPHLSAMA